VGIDGATVFHFRPDRDGPRRFTQYRAFAIDRPTSGGEEPPAQPPAKRRRGPAPPPKEYRWTQQLPILARAMVLADDHLFLAGPPDLFKTDDPTAALEGTRGGALCVVSTADGSQVARYDLKSPPVFDGMAAAGGRLYLATMDGEVLCLREAESK
jgi:hypothetical protein